MIELDRDPAIFRYLLGYLQSENKDYCPQLKDQALRQLVIDEFDYYLIPWVEYKRLDSYIVNTDDLKKWAYNELTSETVP